MYRCVQLSTAPLPATDSRRSHAKIPLIPNAKMCQSAICVMNRWRPWTGGLVPNWVHHKEHRTRIGSTQESPCRVCRHKVNNFGNATVSNDPMFNKCTDGCSRSPIRKLGKQATSRLTTRPISASHARPANSPALSASVRIGISFSHFLQASS